MWAYCYVVLVWYRCDAHQFSMLTILFVTKHTFIIANHIEWATSAVYSKIIFVWADKYLFTSRLILFRRVHCLSLPRFYIMLADTASYIHSSLMALIWLICMLSSQKSNSWFKTCTPNSTLFWLMLLSTSIYYRKI